MKLKNTILSERCQAKRSDIAYLLYGIQKQAKLIYGNKNQNTAWQVAIAQMGAGSSEAMEILYILTVMWINRM